MAGPGSDSIPSSATPEAMLFSEPGLYAGVLREQGEEAGEEEALPARLLLLLLRLSRR